jgi:hypothetical protein
MNYKLAYQTRKMYENKIKHYQSEHKQHQKQISTPTLVLKSHKKPSNTLINKASQHLKNGRPHLTGRSGHVY